VALYPATGTAKGRVDTEAFTRSDLGQKPYARTQQTVEITARVKTVDKEARIVTVEGKNAEVSVQVPDDVNLDEVEPGEMVRVEYVEAAVISVESPEKAGR
jgi:Cu/Ag efflux protein CusF